MEWCNFCVSRLGVPTPQHSSLDDTLKSSGGVALGGIDVQYSRGEFYPAVAEFMLYVNLGPHYTAERGSHKNQDGNANILVPWRFVETVRQRGFKVGVLAWFYMVVSRNGLSSIAKG